MCVTGADRIAQLTAELAEARCERANAQAAEAQAINAKVIACSERDTAVAEAAAMREAILYAQRCTHPWYDPDGKMQKAISGNAGRALAERVPLLEELATALLDGMSTGDWKPIHTALAALDAEGTVE